MNQNEIILCFEKLYFCCGNQRSKPKILIRVGGILIANL